MVHIVFHQYVLEMKLAEKKQVLFVLFNLEN